MQATNRFTTGVYHDGNEVAVRSTSRYSRSKHAPKTDTDGNVVFDDDGRPVPECGGDDDTTYKLATVGAVEFRDPCSDCEDDEDDMAARQSKGAGKETLARLAQRKDFDPASFTGD